MNGSLFIPGLGLRRQVIEMLEYGSVDWFVSEYAKVVDDPWGLSWRPSQKLRYLHTLNLLDQIDQPINSVLDIGCATGDFTYLLSRKYTPNAVLGIDFVEEAVRRAETKYPDLRFKIGSIFDVGKEFEGQVDLATCLEVLYYIDNANHLRVLDAVKNALREGGYALFSSFRGKAPYLSREELRELVTQRFTVVAEQTIYVTPLTKAERIGMKFDKLGQKVGLKSLSRMVHRLAEAFPLRAAQRIETVSSRYFHELAASHSMVLVRKPTG
jgi:trans-aconitate methyltransferase